jgi:hypothetical protein
VVEGYIEQLREKEATSVGERYKEIKKIFHKHGLNYQFIFFLIILLKTPKYLYVMK